MSDLEGTIGLVAMHPERYNALRPQNVALGIAINKFRQCYATFTRAALDLRWDLRTSGGVASCLDHALDTRSHGFTVLEGLVRCRRLMDVCRRTVNQSKDHSLKRSRPLAGLSGAFNALNRAAIGVQIAYDRQEALTLLGG